MCFSFVSLLYIYVCFFVLAMLQDWSGCYETCIAYCKENDLVQHKFKCFINSYAYWYELLTTMMKWNTLNKQASFIRSYGPDYMQVK